MKKTLFAVLLTTAFAATAANAFVPTNEGHHGGKVAEKGEFTTWEKLSAEEKKEVERMHQEHGSKKSVEEFYNSEVKASTDDIINLIKDLNTFAGCKEGVTSADTVTSCLDIFTKAISNVSFLKSHSDALTSLSANIKDAVARSPECKSTPFNANACINAATKNFTSIAINSSNNLTYYTLFQFGCSSKSFGIPGTTYNFPKTCGVQGIQAICAISGCKMSVKKPANPFKFMGSSVFWSALPGTSKVTNCLKVQGNNGTLTCPK